MSDIKKALDSIRERDKRIAHLESQLAALKPAAEAMGVLEQLVPKGNLRGVRILRGQAGQYYLGTGDTKALTVQGHPSLIEAVLMAGGEGANPTR